MSALALSEIKDDGCDLETQFCTFFLKDRLYGFDVRQVQEITKNLKITPIPLAPNYVKGLINLRGQIAVSIDLRELFGLEAGPIDECTNNIICKTDGILLAFYVDCVGEVVELDKNQFEKTVETIDQGIAKYMKGVFKTQKNILSILDIDSIVKSLQKNVKNLDAEE